MSVEGSRVAVIGGSIAGCAAAIGLTRAGCEVTVYERTRGVLRERGFGIGIPARLFDELVAAEYLGAATPACQYSERAWFVADPGTAGRLLATQPMSPIACENWAVLWNALRLKVPHGAYRSGVPVTEIRAGDDRPALTFADGGHERFDLVVGADGYRSTVRHVIAPDAVPLPAGYGLWRATCPVDRVPAPAREMLEHTAFMIAFPGGHAGGYLIPDHVRPGGRLLNWYVYIVPPAPFADLRMILPGTADSPLLDLLDDVLAERFPSLWADVFRCTDRDRISVQPVYDLTVPSYVSGRLAVVGDAGAVARTHTVSGATTALLDALALERWCRTGRGWDEVLDGYNRERCTAGNEQTELGRVLGRAQVTQTPDWQSMSSASFLRWWHNLVSARRSFLGG